MHRYCSDSVESVHLKVFCPWGYLFLLLFRVLSSLRRPTGDVLQMCNILCAKGYIFLVVYRAFYSLRKTLRDVFQLCQLTNTRRRLITAILLHVRKQSFEFLQNEQLMVEQITIKE